MGVQSILQLNLNYRSKNMRLEMKFGSKMIKIIKKIKEFYSPVILFNKLKNSHRKLGKKTFRFRVFLNFISSPSILSTVMTAAAIRQQQEGE